MKDDQCCIEILTIERMISENLLLMFKNDKIFGIQKVKDAMNNIWAASPSFDDPVQVLVEKIIINSSFVLQKVAREERVRCQ